MPSALLRPCSEPGGCPELVESGRCAQHARAAERFRGTATARGYDSHWSKVFRPRFFGLLRKAGVAPVCGGALPGGPTTDDSQCKRNGWLNDRHLQLHHDPPLRDDERADRGKVEDPLRVKVLCASCHSARTRLQMASGVV